MGGQRRGGGEAKKNCAGDCEMTSHGSALLMGHVLLRRKGRRNPGHRAPLQRLAKAGAVRYLPAMTDDDHLYRRGVGVMLLNRDGKVFVAARIDNDADAWQMPQGGLDEGEDAWAAALRELEEETGIGPTQVEQIACSPHLHRYRLPDELVGKVWRGSNWVGQAQAWFLCRFLGRDDDIDLATAHPEFREWKWVSPEQLPELIVPFKRDLYREVLEAFADWL
jgi:putative (di)nucleoside polyphosphate hydrolase